METSNMKNMVVLKNLPSNLVEEAIIILKSNKKVKKLQKIEKKRKQHERVENLKKEKDYIIKEAEMLVANYISKLEDKQEAKNHKKIEKSRKYIRLKNYAYITSIIMIIQAILLVVKYVIKPFPRT